MQLCDALLISAGGFILISNPNPDPDSKHPLLPLITHPNPSTNLNCNDNPNSFSNLHPNTNPDPDCNSFPTPAGTGFSRVAGCTGGSMGHREGTAVGVKDTTQGALGGQDINSGLWQRSNRTVWVRLEGMKMLDSIGEMVHRQCHS